MKLRGVVTLSKMYEMLLVAFVSGFYCAAYCMRKNICAKLHCGVVSNEDSVNVAKG